jgi:hypothetical protein
MMTWDLFLNRLVALHNYKEPETWLSRADVLRLCLERGAPILADEYYTKYGKKVELAANQRQKARR